MTKNETLKEKIQKDLDDGKFYSICSNETTFKEYIFSILSQKDLEVKEMVEKEIEAVMKIWECVTDIDNPVSIETLKKDLLSTLKEN